jgi:hypothetical protein
MPDIQLVVPAAPDITIIESGAPNIELVASTSSLQFVAQPTGPIGPGVVKGGVQYQALIKKSATDFDTEWDDLGTPPYVITSGGISKNSSSRFMRQFFFDEKLAFDGSDIGSALNTMVAASTGQNIEWRTRGGQILSTSVQLNFPVNNQRLILGPGSRVEGRNGLANIGSLVNITAQNFECIGMTLNGNKVGNTSNFVGTITNGSNVLTVGSFTSGVAIQAGQTLSVHGVVANTTVLNQTGGTTGGAGTYTLSSNQTTTTTGNMTSYFLINGVRTTGTGAAAPKSLRFMDHTEVYDCTGFDFLTPNSVDIYWQHCKTSGSIKGSLRALNNNGDTIQSKITWDHWTADRSSIPADVVAGICLQVWGATDNTNPALLKAFDTTYTMPEFTDPSNPGDGTAEGMEPRYTTGEIRGFYGYAGSIGLSMAKSTNAMLTADVRIRGCQRILYEIGDASNLTLVNFSLDGRLNNGNANCWRGIAGDGIDVTLPHNNVRIIGGTIKGTTDAPIAISDSLLNYNQVFIDDVDIDLSTVVGTHFNETYAVNLGNGGCNFVGKIDNGSGGSGTTLTVSSVSAGQISVGQSIPAAATNTVITARGTGTGLTGTYTVSVSQTLSSQSLNSIGQGSSDITINAKIHGAPVGASTSPTHAINAVNVHGLSGRISVDGVFSTNVLVNLQAAGDYTVDNINMTIDVGDNAPSIGQVALVTSLTFPGGTFGPNIQFNGTRLALNDSRFNVIFRDTNAKLIDATGSISPEGILDGCAGSMCRVNGTDIYVKQTPPGTYVGWVPVILSIFGSGPYHPVTAAFLSRAEAMTSIVQLKAQKDRYNDLIEGMYADGDLASVKAMWLLGAPDEGTGLLNIVSPIGGLTKVGGGSTFLANRGFLSDGATYLNTVSGILAMLGFTDPNNLELIEFVGTDLGHDTYYDMSVLGGTAAIRLNAKRTTNFMQTSLCDLTPDGTTASTGSLGAFSMIRDNGANYRVGKNGAAPVIVAVPSLALPTGALNFSFNSNVYSLRRMFGGMLSTAERGDAGTTRKVGRWQTFETAVGAPT